MASQEDMESGGGGTGGGDTREEEEGKWRNMPPEIMTIIFVKLGAVETLTNAQWVCSEWRNCSLDAQIWRSIRLFWHCNVCDDLVVENIGREAASRSSGQLEQLFIKDFATDRLLQHITSRNMYVRRLELENCYLVTKDGFINTAKALPFLEEVELISCTISIEVVEAFGKHCPQLKFLRLESKYSYECTEHYAIAVGKTMPHLRNLFIYTGYCLCENGLRAVLDGCPHLELFNCPSLSNAVFIKNEDLHKRCVESGVAITGYNIRFPGRR